MSTTVNRFLDGEGRITVWPKKVEAKLAVLEYLNDKFESERTYHEREINEILKQWHTFSDWPLLRRELFEQGFMNRNKSGTQYERIK